ncbi:hypothetical protein, partial [Gordonia humi]
FQAAPAGQARSDVTNSCTSPCSRPNDSIAALSPAPSVGLVDSLDLGIALESVAFDYTPVPVELGSRESEIVLEFSAETDQLIHFGIRLFRQLQQLDAVLAMLTAQLPSTITPEMIEPMREAMASDSGPAQWLPQRGLETYDVTVPSFDGVVITLSVAAVSAQDPACTTSTAAA